LLLTLNPVPLSFIKSTIESSFFLTLITKHLHIYSLRDSWIIRYELIFTWFFTLSHLIPESIVDTNLAGKVFLCSSNKLSTIATKLLINSDFLYSNHAKFHEYLVQYFSIQISSYPFLTLSSWIYLSYQIHSYINILPKTPSCSSWATLFFSCTCLSGVLLRNHQIINIFICFCCCLYNNSLFLVFELLRCK
jgi:hypothetical protein